MERAVRLALDVHAPSPSLAAVSLSASFCAGKPALAGEERTARSGAADPGADRRRSLRRGGGATKSKRRCAASEIRRVRFRELLAPRVRRISGVGMVLAVLQQWSGINVIFNYAEEIFRGAGYDISEHLINIASPAPSTWCSPSSPWAWWTGSGGRVLMLAGSGGLAGASACIMGSVITPALKAGRCCC